MTLTWTTSLLLIVAASSARESGLPVGRDCGQSEVDARDITGCNSVSHMRYLGHTNAVWLGDALHHNVDLEALDLHHTKIGDEDALAIAAGLHNNTHLKRLRMHNNTHLKRLRMHNNKITDAGAAALGRALLENDSLEFLSLSSNAVGDEGAKAIADGLRGNRVLRKLDLYFNLVGDEGAKALANALRVNTGLRALHLDSNRVATEGGLAFAAMLRGERGMLSSSQPSSLASLSLSYNQLTNEATDALIDAAASNDAIHQLTLDHNRLVHGDTKVALDKTHAARMAERQAVAQWLIQSGLVDGGHYNAAGPPLATDYAPAVVALRLHTREGLAALSTVSKAHLLAHTALAGLKPDRRETFAAVVSAMAAGLALRDEL